MQDIVFKGPLNSLSFGNVTYNFLREMYRKQMNVAIFPIGDDIKLDAFDKIDENFKKWMVERVQNRFHLVKKDIPTLTMWHLNGSEQRITPDQYLYTFYETNEPTLVEKSICDLQNKTIFSTNHASDAFKKAGCNNTTSIPIGFDEDFEQTGKTYLPNKIHFGLMGKFEKRKNTANIIKAWIKKYGNDYNYQLSCCITNPFFKPEQMNQVISQIFEGKTYGNVNFIPYLKTNSEVNEFMNAVDIDLTGLSGAEGWNLPAFNATCLGKWSIVMNHTSHKEWATKDNCILIEPDRPEPIYDGVFFHQGQAFNQGSMYIISEEKMIDAFEKAEKMSGKPNKKGVNLIKKFNYKNSLNKILETIYE
tara:strand:- start:22236 stop:23321 length:1086 start_codon:yes stop_codon:yes gene_type:complete